MISTLHGQTTLYSNINTDIRIAKETRHQAIELHTDKLLRYLDAGYSAEDLRATLKTYGFLPGDGDLPMAEWVAAVKATGFDGVVSGEILSLSK